MGVGSNPTSDISFTFLKSKSILLSVNRGIHHYLVVSCGDLLLSLVGMSFVFGVSTELEFLGL